MTRETDAMGVVTKAWYERITPQPTVHGKLEEFARAIAEHGNERAREARAAALEEAAKFHDKEAADFDKDDPDGYSLAAAHRHYAFRIRALADTPPQPEGGEG